MDTLRTTLSALDVGLAFLFVACLIALLKKTLRRKAAWTALIAFVGFLAVGLATVPIFDRVARYAGYPDANAKLQADLEARARDRAAESAREKAIQAADLAKRGTKEVKDAALSESATEGDEEKAALVKVMKDVVAARHDGVLPKTMSEEDTKAAIQAASKLKAEQVRKKTKLDLEAMKTKPPPSSGYPEIYMAKEAIAKMMRDPDSTVFGDVFFVNDRKSSTGYYVPVVCGTVNSRNGFGGMTSEMHFVAAMSDTVQGLWLEGTTANNVITAEWNRFCAGRHD
ncbi:MAG: cell envelope integrity protein TolA [Candidatus Acidiferrum sp.]